MQAGGMALGRYPPARQTVADLLPQNDRRRDFRTGLSLIWLFLDYLDYTADNYLNLYKNNVFAASSRPSPFPGTPARLRQPRSLGRYRPPVNLNLVKVAGADHQ